MPTNDKKDYLILQVSNNFTENDLKELKLPSKYVLTEKRGKELEENAYVPYMQQKQ